MRLLFRVAKEKQACACVRVVVVWSLGLPASPRRSSNAEPGAELRKSLGGGTNERDNLFELAIYRLTNYLQFTSLLLNTQDLVFFFFFLLLRPRRRRGQ